MRRAVVAVVAVLAALAPLGAMAATGSNPGPRSNWNDMQKFEYYVGQTGSALNICGNFDYARRLKELSDLSPYGRKGWASVLVYDSIRGGHCGRIAADAEKILADRDRLWAYLTDKYDCPAGLCAPEEGNDSAQAACRPEVDEFLATIAIKGEDVQSVKTLSFRPEGNYVGSTKKGHEAWVRLNSCAGWLIIELSQGCYPQQAFTRGDCAIDGVSRY